MRVSKLLLAGLLLFSLSFMQEDCAGIEGGSTVCLSFDSVDPNTGLLTIGYSSLHPISGFQFNLSGIDILSGSSDLGDVYVVESSGFVMGFLSAGYLAPGEHVLATIDFTPNLGTDLCMSAALIAGPQGVSYDVNMPECISVPSANTGCTDSDACNYDSEAVIDDGSCDMDWGVYCEDTDLDGLGSGEAVVWCDDPGEGWSLDCSDMYPDCYSNHVDDCGECDGNGWDMCDENDNDIPNFEEWGYGPYNLEVSDVENDQGGHVYISFTASFLDDGELNERPTEGYSIERLDGGVWTSLGSFYAYGSESYQTVAETLGDGVLDDDGNTLEDNLYTFRVIAAMDEGNWASSDIEGQSFDNIHPEVPEIEEVFHDENRVDISWNYQLEDDFDYHRLTCIDSEEYTTAGEISNFVGNDPLFMEDSYDVCYTQSVDTHQNSSDQSDHVYQRGLHYGANLVSINVVSDDMSISGAMESIYSSTTSVIGEGVAATPNPVLGWVGSLSEINPASSYWIKVTEPDMLLLTGEHLPLDTEYLIHAGANMIGFPYNECYPISDVLPDEVEGVLKSIIGEGVAANRLPNGQWVGSLANEGLCGGKGYWFKSTLSGNETVSFIYEDMTGQAPLAIKKPTRKNKNSSIK